MSSGKNAIRMKPGVRDHLVVRLAVEALAAVVGEARRGDRDQREAASATVCQRRIPRRAHPAGTVPWRRGRRHRLGSRQGHGGRAAPARRLVQARAARSPDAVGPQRLRARRRCCGCSPARRRVDGGQLAFAKDVARRAARPAPAARPRPVAARLRAAAAAATCSRSRRGSPSSSTRWRTARPTPRRSTPTRARRRRLEHAGGYNWREGVNATLHGLGFRDEHLDRDLATFSGGELTRALARPRAGRRPRPAAARRADQPPRHRVAGVARELPADRSTPPSCSSRTTAGSSRRSAPPCSSSRAAAARFFKGTWHAWRKEKAARELALGRAIEKQEAEIARAGALRRPLPRGHARAPGAVARQAARQDRPDRARPARRRARSASPSSRPSAPAASCSSSRTASCGSATRAAARRRAVARARRARHARRRQRRRARRR